jgi:hypothetical protein
VWTLDQAHGVVWHCDVGTGALSCLHPTAQLLDSDAVECASLAPLLTLQPSCLLPQRMGAAGAAAGAHPGGGALAAAPPTVTAMQAAVTALTAICGLNLGAVPVVQRHKGAEAAVGGGSGP